MGSGTNNRKDNDAPIIRRPINAPFSGKEIPDIGGLVADICIPSFDQRVNKSNLTKPGIKVRLQKKETIYNIYIGENIIGHLTEKYSTMVTKCGNLGVRYFGEIVFKKNNAYARFTRISR